MCKELFLVYTNSAGWWKQSLQSKSCHFIVYFVSLGSLHTFPQSWLSPRENLNVKASGAIGIWSLIIRTSSSNVYAGNLPGLLYPYWTLTGSHSMCGGVCFTLITRSEIAFGLALLTQVCVPDFQWDQTEMLEFGAEKGLLQKPQGDKLA